MSELERKAIDQIAKQLITESAPAELILFQSISDAWHRNDDLSRSTQQSKSTVLNFGSGEMISMITPVALSVVSCMATHIIFDRFKHSNMTFAALFKSGNSTLKNETPQAHQRAILKSAMQEAFSKEELHELCFDFNIDIDELKSATKTALIIDLILLFERQSSINDLIGWCRAKRPGQFEPRGPSSAESLTALELETLTQAVIDQHRDSDIAQEKMLEIVQTVVHSLAMA